MSVSELDSTYSDSELDADIGDSRLSMHRGGHDELLDESVWPENSLTIKSFENDVELDNLNDVYLVAEGQRLAASKAVLSLASPVFKAMFDGFGPDKRELELHGKKIMDVLVFYNCINPRTLDDVRGNMIYNILPLAYEYRVESIMKKCRVLLPKMVSHTLDAKSLCKHLHLAIKYDLRDLETKCITLCSELKLPEMTRWMDHFNVPATVQLKVRDRALRQHQLEADDTLVIVKLFEDPEIITRSNIKTEMGVQFESLLRKQLCRSHLKAIFSDQTKAEEGFKGFSNKIIWSSLPGTGFDTVTTSVHLFGTVSNGLNSTQTGGVSGGVLRTSSNTKPKLETPNFVSNNSQTVTIGVNGGLSKMAVITSKPVTIYHGSNTTQTSSGAKGISGQPADISKPSIGTKTPDSNTSQTAGSGSGFFGEPATLSKPSIGTKTFESNTSQTAGNAGGKPIETSVPSPLKTNIKTPSTSQSIGSNGYGLISQPTALKTPLGTNNFESSSSQNQNSAGGFYGQSTTSKPPIVTTLPQPRSSETTNGSGGFFGQSTTSKTTSVTTVPQPRSNQITNGSGGFFGQSAASSPSLGLSKPTTSLGQTTSTGVVYFGQQTASKLSLGTIKPESSTSQMPCNVAGYFGLQAGIKPLNGTDGPVKQIGTIGRDTTLTLSSMPVKNKEQCDILKVLQGIRLLYKYIPHDKSLKTAAVQYIRNKIGSLTREEKEVYELLPSQAKLDIKGRLIKEIPDRAC